MTGDDPRSAAHRDDEGPDASKLVGADDVSVGLADEDAFADSLVGIPGEESPGAPTTEPAPAGSAAPAPTRTDATGFASGYDGGRELGVEPRSRAAAPAPHRRKWVGRRLGGFRLLGLLGEGTMGIAIRALDVNLGRMVALKVLRRRIEGMDESQRVSQFLREARAAARIDHPCVATIYQIGEHRGWWYIASELVEAGSLHSLVRAAGPLPIARACALIADAASALAAAHQLGIVHRDVKPQNILLDRSGRAKLIDFGLVRVHDPNDPFDFTTRVVGTPLYVAPEVLRREQATGAADVYGLGATFYFALTGGPPFLAATAKEVARRHLTAARPDVRERRADCPARVALLLRRSLAIDPLDRPTAAELEAALRIETIGQLESSRTSVAVEAPAAPVAVPAELAESGGASGLAADPALIATPRPRRTRVLLLGAIAAALLIVAALAWWWEPWKEQDATGPTAAEFASLFPAAPAGYGLSAGTGARAPSPQAERWSWRGRVDPGAARFVGVRTGRRAFPIDDPRAALIPADVAIFFADESAARAAGRRVEPAAPR